MMHGQKNINLHSKITVVLLVVLMLYTLVGIRMYCLCRSSLL